MIGLCHLFPWNDHSFSLATAWYGWLPGRWFGRESALGAYGYVLGGEDSGVLEKLTERVSAAPRWGHYVTLGDLEKFTRGWPEEK